MSFCLPGPPLTPLLLTPALHPTGSLTCSHCSSNGESEVGFPSFTNFFFGYLDLFFFFFVYFLSVFCEAAGKDVTIVTVSGI